MFNLAVTKTDLNFTQLKKPLKAQNGNYSGTDIRVSSFIRQQISKHCILKQPYFYEVLLQKLTYLSTKSLQELSLP